MIKSRGHMDTTSRAKQFAPFAALKGHEMELAQKREVFEERIELAEDEIFCINEVLSTITKGDEVRITFYDRRSYVTVCGTIEKIYNYELALQIKDKRIDFKDIYRIEKMGI